MGFVVRAAEPVEAMRNPAPAGAAVHNIAQMNLRADPGAGNPLGIAASQPKTIRVQTQLRVSTPGDTAEREAQEVGRRIAAMPGPAASPPDNLVPLRRGFAGTVQRRAIGPTVANPAVTRGIETTRGAGAPLSQGLRDFMEPRFRADFSGVRLHRGSEAAAMSNALNAHAFTVGRDIYFNDGQFKPDTHAGRELIAHELAHTIQQGGVIQRAAAETTVAARTGTGVQRGVWDSIKGAASAVVDTVVDVGKGILAAIGDPLNWLADKANMIPGFRLLTIALGVNPINMTPVAATPENVLMGLVELIPGGGLVTQALKNANIFDKVAAWFKQKVAEAIDTASSIKSAVSTFIATHSWKDLADPGALWEDAKRIFTAPYDKIVAFCKGVIVDILKFIKDAILKPLAKLAEGTESWPLVINLLGENPVTGEPVTRDPEVLIGGFMKLIGQEDIWHNMQKSNAVPRAWAWFQGAMSAVKGFVVQIPGKFKELFSSLTIEDIVLVAGAFKKVVGVFGGFAKDFFSWALGAAIELLKIIFDVVSPGAFQYVMKTGAALKAILKDPGPFVKNLIAAAKQGFDSFRANFVEHLKNSLIEWLLGAVEGVYLPKAMTLAEFGKFALSVFGISWAQIRGKIVKALGIGGEAIMKTLEGTFDVIKALVTGGLPAAWEMIKEKLTNLKDMVIDAIVGFVKSAIIEKAIPKLLGMLVPGAGFIPLIVSIWDTIKVFIEKLATIAAVVKSYVNSIVDIAQGNIAGAVKRVEAAFQGMLTLAISFFAGFVGLGGIPSKVKEAVGKLREMVDHGLDTAIGWLVGKAKSFLKSLAQAGAPKDPEARVEAGLSAATSAAKALGNRLTMPLLQPALAGIQIRYGLSLLEAFPRGGSWWARAAASPPQERNMGIIVVDPGAPAAGPDPLQPMPVVTVPFKCNLIKYDQSVYDAQLKGQETGLNALSVVDWEKNRADYDKNGRGSSVPQEEIREQYKKDLAKQGKSDQQIQDVMERLAALHEPDLVAGGFNVISKLGSRYINSSIGSQWKTNVDIIHAGVNKLGADKPKYRINVSLTSTAFTPS